MEVTERSDAALVEQARAGDRDAFGEIYERYANRIYGLCLTIVRRPEDAADATHDTFVRAAQRLDQLREPSRLRPWLFAVARNEALQLIRRTGREDHDDGAPALAAALPTVAAEVEAVDLLSAAELRDLVWDASAGLDDRDRIVLDLYVREGLEGAELGEAMGVSTDYAYQLTHRVRTRIDAALGALLIARLGRRDCRELREILAGWDGTYTPALRRRVVRHVDSCETCSRNRGVLTSPAALFATIPLLPVPFVVKGEVLAAIEAAGLLGGSAAAAGAAGSATAGSASGGSAGAGSAGTGGASGGVGAGVVVGGLVAAAAVLVVIGIAVAALRSDDADDVAVASTVPAVTTSPPSIPPSAAPTTTPTGQNPTDLTPTTPAPAAPSSSPDAPASTSAPAVSPGVVTPPAAQAPAPTAPPPASAPLPPPVPTTPTAPTAPSSTTTIATTTTTTAAPPPPAPAVRVRVDPGVVDFGAGAGTATLTVSNDGSAAVSVNATPADARIAVTPDGSTVPPGGSQVLTVTLNRTGLVADYTSTISLRVGTLNAAVPVRANPTP